MSLPVGESQSGSHQRRGDPSLRTTNALRVSAGGLRLSGYCPGRLHAWVRLTTGTWMGDCTFTVHSGNHRAALELRQWLPASAITRNGTDRG